MQYQKSFTSNTATTIIDLTQLSMFNPNSIYEIGTFNIEVVGNDEIVTMTFFGPFPNSIEQTPESENTFPIGGKTRVMKDAALGYLKFVRTGVTPYQINITKSSD